MRISLPSSIVSHDNINFLLLFFFGVSGTRNTTLISVLVLISTTFSIHINFFLFFSFSWNLDVRMAITFLASAVHDARLPPSKELVDIKIPSLTFPSVMGSIILIQDETVFTCDNVLQWNNHSFFCWNFILVVSLHYVTLKYFVVDSKSEIKKPWKNFIGENNTENIKLWHSWCHQ